MSSLAYLLAPLALLLPNPMPDQVRGAQDNSARLAAAEARADQASMIIRSGWFTFDAMEKAAINHQIRIERRVTIRIAPSAPSAPQSVAASIEAARVSGELVERKFGKCLPISAIAGVEPTDESRLMLFMRDQRLISAELEKACNARDFYSGFYIEKNKDGMLCVERDKLHARTGANCEIESLRQLVGR